MSILRVFERERPIEAIVLIAASVLFAAAVFSPWGWPSVDGYPAIERQIDAGFLVNDFYTNTTDTYNVDTILVRAIGAVQETTGVHYDVFLAGLNFLRCLVWPFTLFLFFKTMANDRFVALIATFLGAASLFALPNLFAWGWLWGDPSTAMFSVLFITAGWAFFIDRRPGLCMAMFVVALLMHPLMAVHGGIFVAITFFIDYTGKERMTALKNPAAWSASVAFLALFIFQYVKLKSAPELALPTSDYVHIIAGVRHPTDFLPSKFSMGDIVAAIFSIASAGLILLKRKDAFYRWNLVAATFISYLIICLCGWLFDEILPVRFFIDLIPFRFVIVGAPIILFIFGVFAAGELKEGRLASFAIIFSLFLLAAPSARIGGISPLVSITLFIWTAYSLLPRNAAPGPLAVDQRRVILLGALVLLCATPAALFARRDEFVIPRIANQHEIYRWAALETPEDAIFLVDQNAPRSFSDSIDPQRMRLVGRRAVVVSKDFPFRDSDMKNWNDRWQVALGGGAERYVSHASGDVLAAIAARYSFDYVIRDEPLSDPRFAAVRAFEPSKGAGAIYVYKRTP